ncbi:MAG: VanZ family protein [Saprospiraceae bacterium]|nr:VanZ family protein [Saprospiraceae bacterium]
MIDYRVRANKVTVTLFVVYFIILCWILLLKLGVRFTYMESRSINFIPFEDAFLPDVKLDLGEIILNVLVFIPLGIYVAILFKLWTLSKKLFFFFMISLMFETLQFILKIGAFDITDLITNTFGGVIGLVVFKIIEKAFNNSVKAQRFINVFATLGSVLLILLLLLLKLNLLPIKYQ